MPVPFRLYTYSALEPRGGCTAYAGDYATVEDAKEVGISKLLALDCEEAAVADEERNVLVRLTSELLPGTAIRVREMWATRLIH